MYRIKFYKTLVLLAWVVVHLYMFRSLGVKVMFDSHRYIQTAEYILNTHTFPTGHNARYLGYSLFLALVLGTGGTLKTVVFYQILLAGISNIALYQIAKKLLQQELTALMTVAGMVIFVEMAQWNMYILTESLFTSTAVLAFYCILQARQWWQYFFCFVILVFIAIIRPNGFIFSVATLAYMFAKIWHYSVAYRTWLLISTGTAIAMLLLILNSYLLTTFRITEVYQRGDIIFGYKGLLIKPLVNPGINQNSSPLEKIVWFAGHNPVYFLKAGSLKLFYFFTHIKPFYSGWHNCLILLFLLPLYYLAMYARNLDAAACAFIYSVIGGQALMVFFTTEDWDGRFLIPVLPFVFLLSAAGVANRFKWSGFTNKNKP